MQGRLQGEHVAGWAPGWAGYRAGFRVGCRADFKAGFRAGCRAALEQAAGCAGCRAGFRVGCRVGCRADVVSGLGCMLKKFFTNTVSVNNKASYKKTKTEARDIWVRESQMTFCTHEQRNLKPYITFNIWYPRCHT